jgi:hypothetical protein
MPSNRPLPTAAHCCPATVGTSEGTTTAHCCPPRTTYGGRAVVVTGSEPSPAYARVRVGWWRQLQGVHQHDRGGNDHYRQAHATCLPVYVDRPTQTERTTP